MAAPKITPEKFNEVVTALRIGADIAGAAHLIAVSKATLDRYMEKRPAEKARADDARKIADDRVQSALYKSAVNGNVTAMIFWLKNRQPKEWRDRREIEMSGAGDVADAIESAHAALLKGQPSGS